MTPNVLSGIRALTFDVFGTVVDWRSSVIHAGARVDAATGKETDWAAFADAWHRALRPLRNDVIAHTRPWIPPGAVDDLVLDDLCEQFDLRDLSVAQREQLKVAWHTADPWPDVVAGLTRLKAGFMLATLSNGSFAQLVAMAKYGGLPWDCVLSVDLARTYKPDPTVYLTACNLLALPPEHILMVAAHVYDLRAAQALGFKTAFVPRLSEFGPDGTPDTQPDPSFDIVAADFPDLARQLGV
jgi:2-haloacid dehalogenase